METKAESTPFQRGAVRVACLFVAVGMYVMIVSRLLARYPALKLLVAEGPPPSLSYGTGESWALFALLAAFPLMVVLGDVCGAALARALGGRVLALASSTDFLLGLGGLALFAAPQMFHATYGPAVAGVFRGLYVLLASAHFAHARRTASKLVWVLVGLGLVWLPLRLTAVYPESFAAGYAVFAVIAIAIDARLTGQGHVPAERPVLAALPLLVASGVWLSVTFALIDAVLLLGVNLTPHVMTWNAGDLGPMERGCEHILTVRPGEPSSTVFLADVRLKQGRWDEADALARPYTEASWKGGVVERMARSIVQSIDQLRALEKTHGAGTLALAKAVEAGAHRPQPLPTEDKVIAMPLYERAAAKDPAAKPDRDRLAAKIAADVESVKPKPAPSPRASPSPRG